MRMLFYKFKKIKMEKLIELWNEYEKTLEPNLQIEWTEVWIKSTPEIVISKKFWFIKRLVKNDKIKKSYREWLPAITKNWFLLEWETVLLMLLAISDNPIEDLLLYLK